MDNVTIAKRVDKYIMDNLNGVPFDKGLPILRKILWQIADEEGISGADVFKIYMDWKSQQA